MDDLNGCAGSHSWGYKEPTEAAWELLEETVEPFVEDMKRHLSLGLEPKALEICQGIVLGLYRLRNDPDPDELLGWAEDFPGEAAGCAVDDWMAGRQGTRAALLGKFVKKHVPQWQWILKPEGK